MISEKEHHDNDDGAASETRYSTCMRCGKALTEPKSIAKGVGPICAQYMLTDAGVCKLRSEDNRGLPCECCGVVVPFNRVAWWDYSTETPRVWHLDCVPDDMKAEPDEDELGV